MKFHQLLLIVFLLGNIQLQAQKNISRIEPPNWWVGMKNSHLQLLVYGNDIGDFNPKISYKGVKVTSVIKVENPNYLFINLDISSKTKAGKFSIDFYKEKKKVESHSYELQARTQQGEDYQGFDNSDVLYLITPDRFANGTDKNDSVKGLAETVNRSNKGGRHGGDIEGIRQHLDYIGDMGFTAIWLNPLLENDMEEYSYHGYSTTDFYKVDTRFGSNEAYRQLSQEANKKGIKLIMDMIVNHCGLNHWWMKDLPSKDWINQWEEYTGTNHRKTLLQDPYASTLDRKIFTDGWFVPTMPDLNQRHPLMANYLTQNGIWWIEYLNLAGIRMDTYPYPDMEYMTEWTRRIMEEYPNFNVVGEEWFENPSTVSYWQEGKKNANGYTSSLNSLMDFPVQVTMVKALTVEESWNDGWIDLYEMLAQDFLYPDPLELVTFPDNHDMSRIFTQLNEDYDLFKMANVFVLTTRGVPQIYYGTEILMKNPESGDHGIIRSDFPGGWAGDKVNAFTGEGLTDQQKEAKNFFKKILHWRQNATAVQTGKLMHFEPKDGVYVYFRYNDAQKVMVVLNKNEKEYTLDLARFDEMLGGVKMGKDVLTDKTFEMSQAINLSAKSALVLELK